MQVRIIGAIAVIAGIVAGSTVASSAQGQQPTPSEPSSAAAEKQKTPRQQKMKDCAAKWKDEKAEKHVSGREAYRTFMKECLKNESNGSNRLAINLNQPLSAPHPCEPRLVDA